MKGSIFKTTVIVAVILLNGCAAKYTPIYPPAIHYSAHDSQDGIELAYKYDVLRERGNNKYAKKEDKKNVKLVAVKITNNTDNAINVGRDIAFFSGQNQVFPLEPMTTKNLIKQSTPVYLLYLLFTPMNLYVSNGTSTETYPVGYILGPGITAGNMIMAGTANSNLQKELYAYNILSMDIQKGETVYGLIGLRDVAYNPLSAKLIEKYDVPGKKK